MRAEKQFLTKEYLARLNASPYFIVVEYTGLRVGQFTDLRRRLARTGAEIHVVKNSVFWLAAKEAGLSDLRGCPGGQLAVVSGQKEISTAAKGLKAFIAEFDKPKIKFGYLNNQRLEENDLKLLADLPALGVLQGKLLGALQAPASKLVALLNTTAAQLVRLLKAKEEKAPAAPAA